MSVLALLLWACPVLGAEISEVPSIDAPTAIAAPAAVETAVPQIEPLGLPAAIGALEPLATPSPAQASLAASPDAPAAVPAGAPQAEATAAEPAATETRQQAPAARTQAASLARPDPQTAAVFDGRLPAAAASAPDVPAGAPLSAPLAAPTLSRAGAPKPGFIGDRIAGDWESYRARHAEALRLSLPVVQDPASFFEGIFNFGKVWWRSTLWGSKLSLGGSISAGRRIVREQFEPRSPGSAAAFERFLGRLSALAESPNGSRKRIASALIESSLLPAAAVPGYLDSLASPQEAAADAAFRKQRQGAVVATFEALTKALIESSQPSNVVGVLLSGSYAYGSAKASSDLDFIVLTRDGSARDVPAFLARLNGLRALNNWPRWPDWDRWPGQNVLQAGSDRAQDFAASLPMLVISPYEDIRRPLEAVAGSDPVWAVSRVEDAALRAIGPAYRWFVRRRLKSLRNSAPARKSRPGA